MDVVHERAAGIDISKRDAKVAVRVPGKRSGSYTTTVKTFGATTAQVLALSDYLLAQRVTTVVMEATSDYWKPFYYVMEDKLPGGMFLHMRDRVTGPACSISPNTRVMFVSYRAGRWCAVSVRS